LSSVTIPPEQTGFNKFEEGIEKKRRLKCKSKLPAKLAPVFGGHGRMKLSATGHRGFQSTSDNPY
jgi:hypothetical protein